MVDQWVTITSIVIHRQVRVLGCHVLGRAKNARERIGVTETMKIQSTTHRIVNLVATLRPSGLIVYNHIAESQVSHNKQGELFNYKECS